MMKAIIVTLLIIFFLPLSVSSQEQFLVPENARRSQDYDTLDKYTSRGRLKVKGKIVKRGKEPVAPLGYAYGREPRKNLGKKFDARDAREYRNSVLTNPIRLWN